MSWQNCNAARRCRRAATGENAVVVSCKKADIIVGPIAIIVADSMLGEITPLMALSIAQSNATRLLLPFNTCNTRIVGVKEQTISAQIQETGYCSHPPKRF